MFRNIYQIITDVMIIDGNKKCGTHIEKRKLFCFGQKPEHFCKKIIHGK
jgi:hypothetical protein